MIRSAKNHNKDKNFFLELFGLIICHSEGFLQKMKFLIDAPCFSAAATFFDVNLAKLDQI